MITFTSLLVTLPFISYMHFTNYVLFAGIKIFGGMKNNSKLHTFFSPYQTIFKFYSMIMEVLARKLLVSYIIAITRIM